MTVNLSDNVPRPSNILNKDRMFDFFVLAGLLTGKSMYTIAQEFIDYQQKTGKPFTSFIEEKVTAAQAKGKARRLAFQAGVNTTTNKVLNTPGVNIPHKAANAAIGAAIPKIQKLGSVNTQQVGNAVVNKAPGVFQKIKNTVANSPLGAITAQMGNPNLGRNLLMIDIETGGLSIEAPIIEYAEGRVKAGKTLPVEEFKIFPVSMKKDRAKVDPVTGQARAATYSIKPTPILSKKQFTDEFGTWAFGSGDKFGLDALYKMLEDDSIFDAAAIAQIEKDVIAKDTIRLQDYTSVKLTDPGEFYTTRWLAKRQAINVAEMAVEGGDIAGANIRFESARLGDVMAAYIDDSRSTIINSRGYAVASPIDPSLTKPDAHGHVAAINADPDIVRAYGAPLSTREDVYKNMASRSARTWATNYLDANNLNLLREMATMEMKDGDLRNLHKLYELTKKRGLGVTAVEMQTLTSMAFSASGAMGYSEVSSDLFTGTSIDTATQALYGEKEFHKAKKDVEHQIRIYGDVDKATDRMTRIAKGVGSNNLIDRLQAMTTAMFGIFDKSFVRVAAMSKARFSQVDVTDALFGKTYSGPAVKVLKQRSIERSLFQLDQSLNAWLAQDPTQLDSRYITKTTVTENGVTSTRWSPSSASFSIYEKTPQSSFHKEFQDDIDQRLVRRGKPNRDLAIRSRIQYEGLISSGKTADEARKTVVSTILDDFYKTANVASSDIDRASLDTMFDEISKFALDDGHRLAAESAFFESGDKAFKDEVVGKIAKNADIEVNAKGYRNWALKTFKKELIGVGVAGAVAAMALPRLLEGDPDTRSVKHPDMPAHVGVDTGRPAGPARLPTFMATGASTIGYREQDLYYKLIEDEEFTPEVQRILDSGTILHEHEAVKKLRDGSAKGAEVFFADYGRGISSFVDIIDEQGRPSDIKSASPERMMQFRAKGPDFKNVSQINYYMGLMNQKQGTLEYVNRADHTDRHLVTLDFDPALFRKDVAKLDRVRDRIWQELDQGTLKMADLPMKDSAEQRRHQAAAHIQPAMRRMSRFPLGEFLPIGDWSGDSVASSGFVPIALRGRANAIIDADFYQRRDRARIHTDRPREADYMALEGLVHGRMARDLRTSLTDFGSPWRGPVNSSKLIQKMRSAGKVKPTEETLSLSSLSSGELSLSSPSSNSLSLSSLPSHHLPSAKIDSPSSSHSLSSGTSLSSQVNASPLKGEASLTMDYFERNTSGVQVSSPLNVKSPAVDRSLSPPSVPSSPPVEQPRVNISSSSSNRHNRSTAPAVPEVSSVSAAALKSRRQYLTANPRPSSTSPVSNPIITVGNQTPMTSNRDPQFKKFERARIQVEASYEMLRRNSGRDPRRRP